MTAPAAAPAASHVVLPALRPAPQPTADRFAFAATLDSLPGAPAKAGSAAAEEGSRTSSDAGQGEAEAPLGQPNRRTKVSDGAFLSTLSLALPSALPTDASASPPVEAPTVAQAPTKGASAETSGASTAATVEPAKQAAARLVGERAFHLVLATSSLAGAGNSPAVRTPSIDGASFAPAPPGGEIANAPTSPSGARAPLPIQGRAALCEAVSSAHSVSFSLEAAPPSVSAALAASKAPASVAARGAAPPASRAAGSMPAAAQGPVRGGRKVEVAAQPQAPRVQGQAVSPNNAGPSDEPADGRPPNSAQSAAQSSSQPAPQASAFGAPAAAPGATAPASGTFDAKATNRAPGPSATAAPQAPAARPVKEIDVDLSPAGLEDVSMTMRLAGDKLSLVVRAASSQTAGSIERAREAIADRLAAIGQPLDSLIVRQTGVNADANADGNGASADDGSTPGDNQAGRSADGHDRSNDPGSSRRSAYRDRGL